MKNILIVSGIYPPDIGGPATFSKEILDFINLKKIKSNLSLYKILQIQELMKKILLKFLGSKISL